LVHFGSSAKLFFEKFLVVWIALDRFGSFWVFRNVVRLKVFDGLDRFGSFWIILDYFGSFWMEL
jgi:hypothetical protein